MLSSIEAEVALLLLSLAAGLFGYVGREALRVLADWRAERQMHHRTLVDLVIHGQFLHRDIAQKFNDDWVAAMHAAIDAEPDGFRPYAVHVPDGEVLEAIRAIRHRFPPEETARIEAYVSQARLFQAC